MIAVFIAMEKEAALLREETTLLERRVHAGAIYELRQKEGLEPFALVISGIGKTRSAAALSALPFLYSDAKEILNAGVSASLSDEIPPYSVICPRSFVNHDIDTTPFGDPPGLFYGTDIVNFPAGKGLYTTLVSALGKETRITRVEASGDRFIEGEESASFLYEAFNAQACDMETGSLAATAYLLGLEFASIRVISDAASKDGYEKQFARCVHILTNAIYTALKGLQQ